MQMHQTVTRCYVFSPKRLFPETGFHRNAFSPNVLIKRAFTERVFGENYGFSPPTSVHRMD
jgi:hypothetical protein